MKWWLTCIKKYVIFEGRARRKEYWMFVLFSYIFTFAAMAADEILTGAYSSGKPKFITSVFLLFIFLPALTVWVRRLHDIGKSGWWVAGCYAAYIVLTGIMIVGAVGFAATNSVPLGILAIAPYVVLLAIAIWMLVWLCRDSQPGPNAYGPYPKEIAQPASAPAPEKTE